MHARCGQGESTFSRDWRRRAAVCAFATGYSREHSNRNRNDDSNDSSLRRNAHRAPQPSARRGSNRASKRTKQNALDTSHGQRISTDTSLLVRSENARTRPHGASLSRDVPHLAQQLRKKSPRTRHTTRESSSRTQHRKEEERRHVARQRDKRGGSTAAAALAFLLGQRTQRSGGVQERKGTAHALRRRAPRSAAR